MRVEGVWDRVKTPDKFYLENKIMLSMLISAARQKSASLRPKQPQG